MRLLTEGGALLVYGGRSGWVVVGVGLLVAGAAFGALPLFLYLRRGGEPFLLGLGGVGLVLLVAGLWAVTHVDRIELDRAEGEIRRIRGSRFLAAPDTLPFERVREVGLARRSFVSVQSGAARTYHVLVVRVDDGRDIEIHDEEVDDELEEARSRGRRIATFVGAPFDPAAEPAGDAEGGGPPR